MFLGPYLLRQLVFVFRWGLLQLCDACLLLLYHWAQVFNTVVVWQLIFGHLQAATPGGKREQEDSMGHVGKGRSSLRGLSRTPTFQHSFISNFSLPSYFSLHSPPQPPRSPLCYLFSLGFFPSLRQYFTYHMALFSSFRFCLCIHSWESLDSQSWLLAFNQIFHTPKKGRKSG